MKFLKIWQSKRKKKLFKQIMHFSSTKRVLLRLHYIEDLITYPKGSINRKAVELFLKQNRALPIYKHIK